VFFKVGIAFNVAPVSKLGIRNPHFLEINAKFIILTSILQIFLFCQKKIPLSVCPISTNFKTELNLKMLI
jgi:hypothetical protein